MEWNDFRNFGQAVYEEHFCEIILKIGQLAYKEMSFKDFSIFSSGQQGGKKIYHLSFF